MKNANLNAEQTAALRHFDGQTPFGAPAPAADVTKALEAAGLIRFNLTGYETTPAGTKAANRCQYDAGDVDCPDCGEHDKPHAADPDCQMCAGKGFLTAEQWAEECAG